MIALFRVLLVLVLLAVFSPIEAAEQNYYKTMIVDGKKNCTATWGDEKWEARSAKLDLPEGEYIFVPVDGAISPWDNDKTAYNNGTFPWAWFVQIAIDNKVFELGTQIKYKSQAIAFSEQKNDKVKKVIDKPTTVYFWIEDNWRGKDYCADNRGAIAVGIIKVR